MRIIAGLYRGRPLVAPAGATTRPTADRVREALFSMLTSRLGSFEGLHAADLFAGSGALGLEALSRGAADCVFVEQDSAALAAIKANASRLGLSPDIRQLAAERFASTRPLDLILIDPPYNTGLGQRALSHLAHRGGVASGAWASIETARTEEIDVPGFTIDAERQFGKARLTLLRYEG
ncbi:16S rRNA (guanine(966)-N(2))-methyltransferase RsmD [Sphingomonas sp. ID0503]|uniref:16S rRNA (guanine(966)-N(2))-methyltransferase RsmD n=1 Tax=Sphingomonas sp. ID0503 TaxID=3399691 RepID=UPI003AFACF71